MKLHDVLSTLEWAEKNFGSLHTNKVCPRRDVMRAVAAGLAESVGMGTPCDEDGFHLYNRVEREGFVLTAAGRLKLAELNAALEKESTR
jgi:hypothetical protein